MFTVLFVLISIPTAISQIQSNDPIPQDLESQLSREQPASPELIRETELFATNGTSFDSFIKQKEKQKEPSDNKYLNLLIGLGEQVGPWLADCSLPDARTLDATLCDSVAALVYELCQGTQYEVSVCISPDLPNYINSRNLSEEQTSMLAYTLMLDLMQ